MPGELIELLLGAVLGDAVSTANPTKMLFEVLKRLGLWAELELLLRDKKVSEQLRELLRQEGKIDWKNHPKLLNEGPLCAHLMEVYLHNGGKRAKTAEKMRMKNMLGKLARLMLAINNNRPEFERELLKDIYLRLSHIEDMLKNICEEHPQECREKNSEELREEVRSRFFKSSEEMKRRGIK